jgi:hypothetical protein
MGAGARYAACWATPCCAKWADDMAAGVDLVAGPTGVLPHAHRADYASDRADLELREGGECWW